MQYESVMKTLDIAKKAGLSLTCVLELAFAASAAIKNDQYQHAINLLQAQGKTRLAEELHFACRRELIETSI